MACVAPVALLAGTSKWGNYIGRPPLDLADVLIVLAFVNLVATRHLRASTSGDDPKVRAAHPILLALLLWSVMRLALSGHFNLLALRDAAPYLYVLVGLAGAAALRRSTPKQRRQTAQILEWVLYFHAGWVVLATVLFPGFYDHLPLIAPSEHLHVFQPRPDFDGAINGVAAAVLLLRVFQGRHPKLCLVGFALSWAAIVQMPSRGGQVGAFIATAFAFYLGMSGLRVETRRKLAAVAIIPLLLTIAVFTIPQTHAWQRLGGTFTQSTSAPDASGTAGARRHAWARLFHWDTESPSRSIVGVGFGPDFMTASGAGPLLTGFEGGGVRSPHNYWLGTYSRLGIPGVGLFAVLIVLLTASVFRLRRDAARDPLLFLVMIMPAALLFPATVGVVMESPFGAIPFFWCAAVLLAYPNRAEFSPRLADGRLAIDTARAG